MGIVKSQWMEQEERGWSDPGTWVCQRCVGDDKHLRNLVRQSLQDGACCSYCGCKARKAAPVSSILDAVLHGVKYRYSDEASAGCPYDKEISIEYVSSLDALEETLSAEGIEWPESLTSDVAKSFLDDGWVDAPDGSWMGSHDHERLHWSWESFARAVKHKTRFHFQRKTRANSYGDDVLQVHEMLPFLGKVVRKHRIIRKLETSLVLKRIREGVRPHSLLDLGPPPAEIASAGRMNPAGIPYLYLAFDEKTAIAETRIRPRKMVTLSDWSPTHQLRVVDLSNLPACPSVFSQKRGLYDMVLFLYRFSDEISKPTDPQTRTEIHYAPTQVVSEYFAQVFKFSDGQQVDGLIFNSSLVPSGKNLVLFPRFEEAHAARSSWAFASMTLNFSRSGRVNRRGDTVI